MLQFYECPCNSSRSISPEPSSSTRLKTCQVVELVRQPRALRPRWTSCPTGASRDTIARVTFRTEPLRQTPCVDFDLVACAGRTLLCPRRQAPLGPSAAARGARGIARTPSPHRPFGNQFRVMPSRHCLARAALDKSRWPLRSRRRRPYWAQIVAIRHALFAAFWWCRPLQFMFQVLPRELVLPVRC